MLNDQMMNYNKNNSNKITLNIPCIKKKIYDQYKMNNNYNINLENQNIMRHYVNAKTDVECETNCPNESNVSYVKNYRLNYVINCIINILWFFTVCILYTALYMIFISFVCHLVDPQC